MEQDVVYFELNNWFAGRDYPDAQPFLMWMNECVPIKFLQQGWVERNKLVVSVTYIDMSVNFCITAPREWVKENCPELLTKYSQFIVTPDEEGYVESRFAEEGARFFDYTKENIGKVFFVGGDGE